MKKPISTSLTKENIAAVIAILSEMPIQLERAIQPLSSEQVGKTIAEGERSIKGIMAHLIQCEERNTEAIYLALLVNEPMIINIHAERQWGNLLRYDRFECSDLLAYFKFRRRVFLSVLTSLSDAQWGRTIREENKKRQESVYWRARSQAMHELEHLDEIQTKLSILS